MICFNPAKEFLIRTDASKYAVGASPEQADANGDYRPVAFFSHKLQGRDYLGQRAWSTREKETYALIGALQKFGAWIQSTVLTRSRGGPGHGTLRRTRTGKQASKALRSQGHPHARVM